MKLALTLYFDNFGTLKNTLDGLPAGLIDSADIATTDAGSPDPCPDKDADGCWTDTDGTKFDPALHAWNKEHKCPSVTPSGKFRRKRGAAAVPPSEPGEPGPAVDPGSGESGEPEDEGSGVREVTADTLSPVARAIHSHIEHAADPVALNRIEANPTLASLADPERQFLDAALRERAEELIALESTE